MARNQNTEHRNGHTFYIAMSEGGKSTALKNNPLIPKRGGRGLFYDPDLDHWALHCHTINEYLSHVKSALRSGKPFRIAYTGRGDSKREAVENFERWCRIAWGVLDGDAGKETDLIIEELADVSPGAGKATVEFGQLLRRSRKYGGRLHMTSQRPQEISKTALSQAGTLWIGIQQTATDRAHVAGLIDVPVEDLAKLEKLQFYVKNGPRPATLIDLRKLFKPIKVAPPVAKPAQD